MAIPLIKLKYRDDSDLEEQLNEVLNERKLSRTPLIYVVTDKTLFPKFRKNGNATSDYKTEIEFKKDIKEQTGREDLGLDDILLGIERKYAFDGSNSFFGALMITYKLAGIAIYNGQKLVSLEQHYEFKDVSRKGKLSALVALVDLKEIEREE